MAFPTLRARPGDGSGGVGIRRNRRRLRHGVRRPVAGPVALRMRGTGGLRMLGALAAGAALYLGTAPRTWWWSAILGLALLGVVLHGRGPRAAAGLSLLAGVTYFVPLLSWSGVYVGAVPWLALAVAGGRAGRPGRDADRGGRVAGCPAGRCSRPPPGCSARRCGPRFPFGGFPWGGIAFTQAGRSAAAGRVAARLGGLAFVTALAGFGLADLGPARAGPRADRIAGGERPWSSPSCRSRVGTAGLLTEHDTSTDPQQTVAVIQGNVPRAGLDFNAQRRAVLDNHAARTARARRRGPGRHRPAADAGDLAGELLRHRPVPQRRRRRR